MNTARITQVFKCLLVAVLLGLLGFAFVRFSPCDILPNCAVTQHSWRLGFIALLGFWWANCFTSSILMKKLTRWDIAYGSDSDSAWLGSVPLAILNLIVRWLLVPVVNILFAWFIQAWLLNTFMELPSEVSWVVALLQGLVVTPLVMTIADPFLLVPFAWIAAPFNLYSMHALSVEVARRNKEETSGSQDDVFEGEQTGHEAVAESDDASSQCQNDKHGCLSGLFAFLAVACFLIPLAHLFRFNALKSIPLIGQHPFLSPIGLCWLFGFLSNRLSKVGKRISLAAAARTTLRRLPDHLWLTFVAGIQFAFAFNLFGMLFFGAATVMPALTVVVRLFASYLMGYMLGRLYLRLHPFHCDESDLGFRWGGFVMSTVYLASIYAVFLHWVELSLSLLIYVFCILIPFYTAVLKFTGRKVFRGDIPYVVFLRRFNRYADRAIMGTVLNTLPSGLSAAFLISQSRRLTTWDPMVTLLNGITRGNPSRGLPFYLISKDDTWAQNVQRMLDKASSVVMDISDPSESIRQEVSLLATGSMLDRVLFLINHKTSAAALEFLQTHGVDCAQARIVVYRRSWMRAAPRMIVGLAGTFYSMTILFYSLQLFEPSFSNFAANLSTLISTLILFPIFFVKPSIDRDSSVRIKSFLKNRQHEEN